LLSKGKGKKKMAVGANRGLFLDTGKWNGTKLVGGKQKPKC